VAFLDCDIGISSEQVFNFIKKKLSYGAFIIIDDFFNCDINQDSIFKRFYRHFILNKNVFIHSYFGNAGVVFKYVKE